MFQGGLDIVLSYGHKYSRYCAMGTLWQNLHDFMAPPDFKKK